MVWALTLCVCDRGGTRCRPYFSAVRRLSVQFRGVPRARYRPGTPGTRPLPKAKDPGVPRVQGLRALVQRGGTLPLLEHLLGTLINMAPRTEDSPRPPTPKHASLDNLGRTYVIAVCSAYVTQWGLRYAVSKERRLGLQGA